MSICEERASLPLETTQDIPFLWSPILWYGSKLTRNSARHAQVTQDDRKIMNQCARDLWPIPVGHALNRAGILMCRIHEHHAGNLARMLVMVEPNDVPKPYVIAAAVGSKKATIGRPNHTVPRLEMAQAGGISSGSFE